MFALSQDRLLTIAVFATIIALATLAAAFAIFFFARNAERIQTPLEPKELNFPHRVPVYVAILSAVLATALTTVAAISFLRDDPSSPTSSAPAVAAMQQEIVKTVEETQNSIGELTELELATTSDLSRQLSHEIESVLTALARINPDLGATTPLERSTFSWLIQTIVALAIVTGLVALLARAITKLAQELSKMMSRKWSLILSIASIVLPSVALPFGISFLENSTFDVTLLRFEPKTEVHVDEGASTGKAKEVSLELDSAVGKLDCGESNELLVADFKTNSSNELEAPDHYKRIDKLISTLHEKGRDRHLSALILIGSADERALATPPTNDHLAEDRAKWTQAELEKRLLSNPMSIGRIRMLVVNSRLPDVRVTTNDGRQLARAVKICALWSLG